MNKLISFTLAEMLIVFSIIGIIAEYTIPSLVKNVYETAYQTAQDVFLYKLREATAQMRVNDELHPDGNTSDFIKNFQNYMKIDKICNPPTGCFADTFRTASGKTLKLNSYTYSKDIGQSGLSGNSTVGVKLVNGTTMIFSYDPTFCEYIYSGDNTKDTTTCLSIVYDINGAQGPNVITKDISTLNAKLSECDGQVFNGNLCVNAGDTTYNTVDGDYWLGAKAACQKLGMRLPSLSELSGTISTNKSSLGLTTGVPYWSSDYAGTNLYKTLNFTRNITANSSSLSTNAKLRCVN